jgi:hypothetical protein
VFHYRKCGEEIMAAETKECQLKGRGVRGLKSTTATKAASTSSRKPGICSKSETKVACFWDNYGTTVS